MKKSYSIFLCGDVMTGRGVDQIMPHPSNPVLYESYVKNAKDYVNLAENVNGKIDKPVDYTYIWGTYLNEIKKADVRIINLETSITKNEGYFNKGINYRMHPENIHCLNTANINCCVLANNHVLDWGENGLIETLKTLKNSGIKYAGAGKDINEAETPCILTYNNNRILVFSYGLSSSGIPNSWAATNNNAGVNLLPDLSMETVKNISANIKKLKQKGDLVIASIHWGGNWGYEIPLEQKNFAHNLIEFSSVDVIHGHSSHHPKGIEIFNNKLIIYGCGDFINDYEGISGHEAYRDDLGFMYLVNVNPDNNNSISLNLLLTQIKKMQLTKPNKMDLNWLWLILNREGHQFGTKAEWVNNYTLTLTYSSP